MVLSAQEVSLIGVIRALPSEEAGKVLAWARHLSELSSGGPMEWSDSWSEQDMADATRAALQRLENDEQSGR